MPGGGFPEFDYRRENARFGYKLSAGNLCRQEGGTTVIPKQNIARNVSKKKQTDAEVPKRPVMAHHNGRRNVERAQVSCMGTGSVCPMADGPAGLKKGERTPTYAFQ